MQQKFPERIRAIQDKQSNIVEANNPSCIIDHAAAITFVLEFYRLDKELPQCSGQSQPNPCV